MAIEEAQTIFGHSPPASCLLSIDSGISSPVSFRKQETNMTKLIQQVQMDTQTVTEQANK